MRQPTSAPSTRGRGCFRFVIRTALVSVIVVNGLAWVQARAATHFVADGLGTGDIINAPLMTKLQVLTSGAGIPRPRNQQTPDNHNLPYEVRQIPVANSELLEGWFVPPPQSLGLVVMFPGYIGVKDALLTPAAYLYQFGYSSLLVDFRGAGGSSRNDTTIGMRESEDVAAAFAYAQQQWPGQPIILYGISMGSAAILRSVALQGVRPAAIIIEGSYDNFLTTIKHRFDAAGVPSFPLAELLLFWGSIQMGYNGFSNNPSAYAASVDCPTLLMSGGDDPWVRPNETQAIADQIHASKQVVIFPNLGHQMPFVYFNPTLWVDTVRQFLAQVPPAAQHVKVYP